jgi:hypothetical protein
MKITAKRRTVVLVTVGTLGLGGIAAATPALAGTGLATAARAAVTQQGPGGFGHGPGMGDGTCPGRGVTAPQGTLTDQQMSTLVAMAQQEKLAHDLYVTFGVRYPAPVFAHIAMAESRHLTAVRTLLARYGVNDPTAGTAVGSFSDRSTRATYDRLLARGSTDQTAALRVGQEVERADIADLRRALAGLTAPDVTQLYQGLLAASERHLTAFTRWATR